MSIVSAACCCSGQETPGEDVDVDVGRPALSDVEAPVGDDLPTRVVTQAEASAPAPGEVAIPEAVNGRRGSGGSMSSAGISSMRSFARKDSGGGALVRSKSSISARINLLSRETSEELMRKHPQVAGLISFQGRQELLRASRLGHVMKGGAKILKLAKGSAHTYALSEEVREIAAFISHNWVVSRTKKFFCLAVYYNFNLGFVAALLSIAVIVAATSGGLIPTVTKGDGTPVGICGTLFVTPMFFLVVFQGHKLHMLTRTSPKVFLDKTCIHQVDTKLQQEGIRKLGAFIRSSQSMVVIYSDVYLKKLWTVYEVACFLSMHSKHRMFVVPTFLPALCFGGLCIFYMSHILQLLADVILDMPQTIYLFYLAACFPFMAVLRGWARKRMAINETMANFRVEECMCAVESDREIVYANIAALMRATGAVDVDATEEQTRVAFNEFVRECLPDALALSVGRFGIKYVQMVSILVCTNLPQSLDTLYGMESDREKVRWIFFSFIWVFGIIPVASAFMATWSGACLHLRGCCEWAYLSGGILGMMIVIAGPISIGITILFEAAVGSDWENGALAGMILLWAVLVPLNVYIFDWQRAPSSRAQEELEIEPSGAEQASQHESAAARQDLDWEEDDSLFV